MKKIVFCFDLDNTLCVSKKKRSNYFNSKPKKKAIKIVNKLYDTGHIIKIYTARYMGRNNDKLKLKKSLYIKTFKQLKKWDVKFHKLILSKPSADIYIDDKAYGYSNTWQSKFKKYLK